MKTFLPARTLAALAFLSLCLAPAAADQICIRNRPFKGAVSSSGGHLWVELKPIAEALGANLVDNGSGGYALSMKAISADSARDVPTNKLMVGTSTLDLQSVDGIVEVPLDDVAKLVNAKVIRNKALGSIDVSFVTAMQVAPPEPVAATKTATPKSAKGGQFTGHLVHLHGKIKLEGANQVGLFTGGDADAPYKKGSVDPQGNYSIDIDLDKDLHGQGEMAVTDMRFFRDGAFGECHGCCNFIYRSNKKVFLQIYEGPTLEIGSSDFQYDEK